MSLLDVQFFTLLADIAWYCKNVQFMSALSGSLIMIIVIHMVQTFLLSHNLTLSCFLGQINIPMKGAVFLYYCL